MKEGGRYDGYEFMFEEAVLAARHIEMSNCD